MARRSKEEMELIRTRQNIKLTDIEQETVIQFDNSSNIATVYSANKSIINKLDKLGYVCYNVDTIEGNVMAKTYKVPKKLISFRKERQLSEKTKAKAAERMKKLHENR